MQQPDTEHPQVPLDQDVKTLFNGNKELALFFTCWLQNNRNATKAYLQLHPQTNYNSARTLGARMLAKVDISTILSAYGLDTEKYLQQLKLGLEATKTGSGNLGEPDHTIRRTYHAILGRLLNIEKTDRALRYGKPEVTVTLPDWWLESNPVPEQQL